MAGPCGRGLPGLVGVLVTWPLACLLEGPPQSRSDKLDQLVGTLNDRLLQLAIKLDTIAEQQLLSDLAKSAAFRDKDREALRKAIRQDLDRKDWEAAIVLVDDMERAFGYKQEADRIRLEINAHRADVIGKIVTSTAQTIDQHCRSERWPDAQREAEKLIAQFPNHEQVQKLPQEIDARRQQEKKDWSIPGTTPWSARTSTASSRFSRNWTPIYRRWKRRRWQESARSIFKEKIHSPQRRSSRRSRITNGARRCASATRCARFSR